MSAPRRTSVSKELARHSISEGAEAAKVRQKKIDASPKREDFEREFGKDRVKDEKDGSWTLTLREPSDIRRAHEMQEGARRIDVERGYELHSRNKKQKVFHKDGRIIEVDEAAERAGHKNIRPLGRGGVSAALRFSMTDAFGKYEKGPDGLWFVWNDGWEATTLFSKDVPSPQRDPYGNVWVKRDGEWVLESEVA